MIRDSIGPGFVGPGFPDGSDREAGLGCPHSPSYKMAMIELECLFDSSDSVFELFFFLGMNSSSHSFSINSVTTLTATPCEEKLSHVD